MLPYYLCSLRRAFRKVEVVNEISRQYNGAIDVLNDKLSNNYAELADMKQQLEAAMKALVIVNNAKNTPRSKELGLQRISIEDYKIHDNTSIQHSEETENKFTGPPESEE